MAVVVTVVFLLIHLIPGDPVGVMLGPDATPAQIEATRRSLGLDRPIHEQLFKFYARVLQADLGQSYFLDRPVVTALAERAEPALSLGFNQSALIARISRSFMLEVLSQDYIRTARAKGLSQPIVLWIHGFRNALVPVVTVIGVTMAVLIGGAVVTEIVFNIPGLGRLIISAILRRDYPVVQGVVLVTAAAYVLINLMVDVVNAFIDPRIRYE